MTLPVLLSADEIAARLATLVTSSPTDPWRVEGLVLKKSFRFGDFAQAFGFMSEVALVAQSMDHHPAWTHDYKTVDVWLSTHSAGGLTTLDFDLADKIERIASRRNGTA